MYQNFRKTLALQSTASNLTKNRVQRPLWRSSENYELSAGKPQLAEGSFLKKIDATQIFCRDFCKIAPSKMLESFLWDIFAIPFTSKGGNFTENSVFGINSM